MKKTEIVLINPCHFEKGDNKNIAAVFSAPGSKEEENGKPAAGKTGDNLKIVLNHLNLCRNDITITNAWPFPEYKAKTNRSEANLCEIKSHWNIERLKNELNEIKTIICFGKKAQAAIKAVNFKNKNIIEVRHLGLQSINQIKVNENITDRTQERLFTIAKEIKNKL